MLVAHFAFRTLQSGVSVAEPPYFSLGRHKLRSNKELWLACTWNVPRNRQQDSDTAFFLLSKTALWPKYREVAVAKVPMMEWKSALQCCPAEVIAPLALMEDGVILLLS